MLTHPLLLHKESNNERLIHPKTANTLLTGCGQGHTRIFVANETNEYFPLSLHHEVLFVGWCWLPCDGFSDLDPRLMARDVGALDVGGTGRVRGEGSSDTETKQEFDKRSSKPYVCVQ